MADARKAIQARNWSAAQASLKLAIRDEPRNADAHNFLPLRYCEQTKPACDEFEDLQRSIAQYKATNK